MGWLANVIMGGVVGGHMRHEMAQREFEARDPSLHGFQHRMAGKGDYVGQAMTVLDADRWRTMGSNYRRGAAAEGIIGGAAAAAGATALAHAARRQSRRVPRPHVMAHPRYRELHVPGGVAAPAA